MKSISAVQLSLLLKNAEKPFLLIDVREKFEHDEFNIGGMLMPLSSLLSLADEIPMDMEVILYCQKGIRSALAIQRLEKKGFKNLVNLTGGIEAWKNLQGQD